MYMHTGYAGHYYQRPTEKDFDLKIVSKHQDFENKPLKKYNVDNIDTVGAYEEPFEIHFSNNSTEDASVRISLDGVDVLTGKPANLNTDHQMWFVKAGKTLHLKAWAETSNGGSRFVFTGANKSVALHTSGDLSHKGIIAAAVFTERSIPYNGFTLAGATFSTSSSDIKINNVYNDSIKGRQRRSEISEQNTAGELRSLDQNLSEGPVATSYSASMDSLEIDLKREASVGAGEYTTQKTHTVAGLKDPVLNCISKVRYLWWSDLHDKLKAIKPEIKHPSGFPGVDEVKHFHDLSNVPKVENEELKRTVNVFDKKETIFDRVSQ